MVCSGGDIGVVGERDRQSALAEGLLDVLDDGVVKALDLLCGRLAAEQGRESASCRTRAGRCRW